MAGNRADRSGAPKHAVATNEGGQAPVSKTGVAHEAKGSIPSPSSKFSVAAINTAVCYRGECGTPQRQQPTRVSGATRFESSPLHQIVPA